MQYLSEFEILSQPIVPPSKLPPGVSVPFVAQGYFVLITRLPDTVAGNLTVTLGFNPSVPLPTGNDSSKGNPFLLVDYEGGDGTNTFLPPSTSNTYSVNIGSGQTVLFGIQPDVVNTDADGPLGTGTFGARGYVTISATGPAAGGTFQLAVVPEIRATFFSVGQAGGLPVPDFAQASQVAYVLPTSAAALITLSKSKETKEKEKDKEGSKDSKDIADSKTHSPDKIRPDTKNPIDMVKPFGDPGQVQSLSDRLAALESLVGTGATFITPDQRPKLG